MKSEIEKRKPEGFLDHVSLAITTFGVGYLPLAPGTWGSMVGVAIYLGSELVHAAWSASLGWRFVDAADRHRQWPVTHDWSAISQLEQSQGAVTIAFFSLLLVAFCLVGVWAAGRATVLLGNSDPSEAVVDEVLGQLITFTFVPFGIGWPLVLAGFLLFRLFDIWKPYPIDSLQNLPAGIGICADDILAGVYAGVCLAVIYAVSISV